jgi:hypothetical protein
VISRHSGLLSSKRPVSGCPRLADVVDVESYDLHQSTDCKLQNCELIAPVARTILSSAHQSAVQSPPDSVSIICHYSPSVSAGALLNRIRHSGIHPTAIAGQLRIDPEKHIRSLRRNNPKNVLDLSYRAHDRSRISHAAARVRSAVWTQPPQVHPQLILASGDVAEWCMKSEFEDVPQFVVSLNDRLKVPHSRIVTALPSPQAPDRERLPTFNALPLA